MTSSFDSKSKSRRNVQINVLNDGSVDNDTSNIVPGVASGEVDSHVDRLANLDDTRPAVPWYRRPAPAWVLCLVFLGALAMTGTIAPRVEIYIKLTCQEIRPDFDALLTDPGSVIGWPSPIGTVTIPRPSAKCQADPQVQQAVARLGATITTIMGTLSCLTSGWWGKFSDTHGRLKILGLTLLGVLASDIVFITVSLASDKLPWGYRFLIVAPIIEGILGGIATGSAASHAYLTDTTTAANRSRTFSLMVGLLFCGMALGPTLGGILVSKTDNLLSVFYVAASIHTLLTLYTFFIVPESLSKEAIQANRELAKKQNQQSRLARHVQGVGPFSTPNETSLWSIVGKIFFFATPLSIFLPSSRGRNGGLNWNLTLLAVAYGTYTAIIGSYQFKFQYASYTFGWTSQELGYWMGVIGTIRAVYLIAILPLLIKLLHPKPTSEGVTNSNGEASAPQSQRVKHDPAFDLIIARASLAVEIFQYTLVLLSRDVVLYIVATILSSFGGGFSPAVQSLAVELAKAQKENSNGMNGNNTPSHAFNGANVEVLTATDPTAATTATASGTSTVTTAIPNPNTTTKPAESTSIGGENYGQLFGGLAVIQALCSQMIGPSLFGAIFVGTVENFPKAIFAAALALVFTGLVCLSLIRVPKRAHGQDATIGSRDPERQPLLGESEHVEFLEG